MPTPAILCELLPLIAPICIAIGQLFNHLNDLCKTKHLPRTWRWLRWPQSCILLALSLIIPWGLANQQSLISSGFYPASLAMDIQGHIILSLLCALLGLWILSLAGVMNHRPSRAVICWSLWCLVLATIVITPLSRCPAAKHLGRDETIALSGVLDQAVVLWIQRDVEPQEMDPRVLFYVRRTIPGIPLSQLDRALLTLKNDSPAKHVVLISPMDMKLSHPQVRAMGMLRHSRMRLWRYDITDTTSPETKN
ncbi:MAG: hypothetical protein JKX85_11980 [Phycisphaeraceae bacterium]|nr:hypothetical protein [Phycisphaeraceae bacterium]